MIEGSPLIVTCRLCGEETSTGNTPDVSGAVSPMEDPNQKYTVCEKCGKTTPWGPEDVIVIA